MRRTGHPEMRMRVDADDGRGDGDDEEGAIVVLDMHPVLPQVSLPDESGREAQAKLPGGFVRCSIVRVNIITNEWR